MKIVSCSATQVKQLNVAIDNHTYYPHQYIRFNVTIVDTNIDTNDKQQMLQQLVAISLKVRTLQYCKYGC